MADWVVVLLRTSGMFLVMLVGWFARRRESLSAESTAALSRLVVDIALPALIVHQMITTLDAATLREGWFVPLLAAATVVLAQLVGLATAPLFSRPGRERATYVFVVALSNWALLPLPIAEALYGDKGKLVVLLYNVGGLVMMWTLGLRTLRAGRNDRRDSSLRFLVTNPGLIATVGGIVLALALPQWRATPVPHGVLGYMGRLVMPALGMIGDLTVPLSLMLIGAQLANLPAGAHTGTRALAGAIVSRLILAPLTLMLLMAAIVKAGFVPSETVRTTVTLISGMPVAVNCGVLAQRYDGDVSLASRAIFFTTLLSIVTVPALLIAARALQP